MTDCVNSFVMHTKKCERVLRYACVCVYVYVYMCDFWEHLKICMCVCACVSLVCAWMCFIDEHEGFIYHIYKWVFANMLWWWICIYKITIYIFIYQNQYWGKFCHIYNLSPTHKKLSALKRSGVWLFWLDSECFVILHSHLSTSFLYIYIYTGCDE